jgi:adenylate cyclase
VSSLIHRVRERKIVRWALGYLAGAWLVLQVLELVSDAFDWPAPILRGTTALLAVGLLAALVLAWYHGEKGRQRVSGPEVVMLVGILGTAAGSVALVTRPEGEPVVPAPPLPRATLAERLAAPFERSSIAVLPFLNLSDDAANEYFSDGVAEELLNLLAKVDGLRVAARTSSFSFRGSEQDVREIGDRLDVAYVLEGSVRRAERRVRLTAQLIDAATGYHVWSETYDRELGDVFAVQEEVARAIAGALELRLPTAAARAHYGGATLDPAAYNEYLLGLHYWNQRTAEDTQLAMRHLERAIELDPEYARAHALLALTWVIAPDHLGVAAHSAAQHGRAAAERALALDAGAADAYTALAGLALLELDWAAAAPLLERAIELNPSFATAYTWYANLLRALGRMDEALAFSARATELDPLATPLHLNHAINLATAGRLHEADALAGRVLELRPDLVILHYLRAIVRIELGEYDAAAASLAHAASVLGRSDRALRDVTAAIAAVRTAAPDAAARRRTAVGSLDAWVAAEASNDLDHVLAAALYTALGEGDRALDRLEHSLRFAADVLDLPAFAPLRGRPRFEELRLRASLAPSSGDH